MKNLFSILFFFAAINVALAQSKATQKQYLTLGGIESGSTVSIMQVLDYPVLVSADKNEKIKSFDIVISANKEVSEYKVVGTKFSQEAIGFLRTLNEQSGNITIKNIIVTKESIKVQEKNLEYTFE